MAALLKAKKAEVKLSETIIECKVVTQRYRDAVNRFEDSLETSMSNHMSSYRQTSADLMKRNPMAS